MLKAHLVAAGNRHPRPRSQRTACPLAGARARGGSRPPPPGHPQGQNLQQTHRQPLASSPRLLALRPTSLRNNKERGRIQARGAPPDLLKIHLRQLRKHQRQSLLAALATTSAPTEDPNEYKAKRVLGAAPRPAEASCRPMPKQARRQARGRRHGWRSSRRHPRLRGAAKDTPESWPRQASAWGITDRCDRHRSKLNTPPAKAMGLSRKSHRSVICWAGGTEYFLTRFASAEEENGASSNTPVWCGALPGGDAEPYKGRIYDPCCGSEPANVSCRARSRGKPRRPGWATFPSTAR